MPRIPFLPWLKPGLANCITVVWIIRFGVKDAILFTLLRSWISGFYFGFSLLTLSLSLSGGIVATAAMGMAWNVLGKRGLLGTIGLSITGHFSITVLNCLLFISCLHIMLQFLPTSLYGSCIDSFWHIRWTDRSTGMEYPEPYGITRSDT